MIFIIAAAKDGEMLLTSTDADTYEEAVDMGLGLAADQFFGKESGSIDESMLGGFEVRSLDSFEAHR